MSAGWKSQAVVVAAAIAGGVLSLHVHSFHQFHPTPVGLLAAYLVGAAVCSSGAWCLLAIVGRWRFTNEVVSEMADPRVQQPRWWVEPSLSQESTQESTREADR